MSAAQMTVRDVEQTNNPGTTPFSKTSRPALGVTHPFIKWVLVFVPGIK